MEVVNRYIELATNLISSGGIFYGFILILIESFIPILPLGVFIALNVSAYGMIKGIIISWIATCIGCFLSYSFFYYLSNKFTYKLFSKSKKKKIEKAVEKIGKIPFPNLVLLIALPFTPAFLINIVCGISKISRKKFIAAIIIGKIFMIIFWSYIGKSLIESMTDINTIIIISIMLVVAYGISKFVSKKINIE
ncbi:MAG: TVP38/TMEM64 family protein [Firmicutes bacterium]|nr:TVP38/TMEM64 family protein [Bacillota bacterium]